MATEFQFSPGLGYTLEGRCPWQNWVPAVAGKVKEGKESAPRTESYALGIVIIGFFIFAGFFIISAIGIILGIFVSEFDGTLAARRQHAFHAEPYRTHGSRPWTE